jgi:hypothetical protein
MATHAQLCGCWNASRPNIALCAMPRPLTPEAQDYRVVLEVVDAPEVSFEELLREALETA